MRDTRTGLPLGAALVFVDEGPAAASTGGDGSFSIGPLLAGTHQLRVWVAPFERSAPLAVVVRPGETTEVVLEYELALAADAAVTARAPVSRVVQPPSAGSVVLDGRHIAEVPGGLDDVGRVLQVQPGAAASQDDRNDLLVRGGGAFESAVRLDGFDLPATSHFSAQASGSGGISLVSPSVIGRVLFQAGSFSVAHGERASALVEIGLREATGRRLGGLVSVSPGGATAQAEGRVGAAGSWLVAARRSLLEAVYERGDSEAVPTYHDLLARTEVSLAGRHRLRVLALYASDGVEVKSRAGSRDRILHDDQRLQALGIGVRSAWSDKTTTELTLSVSDNEVDAWQRTGATLDGVDYTHDREVRVRFDGRWAVRPQVGLRAGASLKHADFRFDFEDTPYRNAFGILVPALHAHGDGVNDDLGGYAEADWTIAGRVRGVLGIRADRWGASRSWTESPRVRLEWSAWRSGRVTASWGDYRQSIPYAWQASDVANRGLPPVRARQGSVGIEWESKRAGTFSVEAFAKRYRGYPADPATPGRLLSSAGLEFDAPFVGRLRSDGEIRAHGVDAAAARRVGRRVEVAVTGSAWRVRQRALDGVWRDGDFDIRRQLRVSGAWRAPGGFDASAAWRFASGRPYTPFDVKASTRARSGRYDRTRINAERYPAYHRLDVRVSRTTRLSSASLTMFVEVNNAYDRSNVWAYEWLRDEARANAVTQWGRMAVAGVRVEF